MSTYGLIKTFIKDIFPLAHEELAKWKRSAEQCPDDVLRAQAVLSITNKGFHVQGGSVYALYPGALCGPLVKLIASYQTISDYLDNLCDRAGAFDENAFQSLHIAMVDALDETSGTHDYYEHYPYKEDGGYLVSLIKECRLQISKMPSYNIVKDSVINFAKLYSSLQVYKHLSLDIREDKMLGWADKYTSIYPDIMPSEFCAASGSTLGIFILFAVSSIKDITKDNVQKIKASYFPWICGFHILLDYFIDTNEDKENKDLNFLKYYKDKEEILERLTLFCKNSLNSASSLDNPVFHITAVNGLSALYLSDNKAYDNNLYDITKSLISRGGIKLKLMHYLCRKLRSKRVI